MSWKVQFYNEKVVKDVEKWPLSLQAKFGWIVKLIEAEGPLDVGLPHVKQLGKGLLEIRVKSLEGIARALFCLQNKKIVLVLSGFIKKTQKTPARELELALKRMKEVLNHGKAD